VAMAAKYCELYIVSNFVAIIIITDLYSAFPLGPKIQRRLAR